MAEVTYNSTELLATVAASVLEDGKTVLVGTGLPMIAAMLAQRTRAPNILMFFEAGGVGPQMPVLPISVGDSRTFYKAIAASSMHDTMSLMQAGYIDYGFLGAAQIDCYGNINTTVIGDWNNPKARLPGSGGANDVASLCNKTIIILRQDRMKFVSKVDFITSPGFLTGPGAREAAGLPSDNGPFRVITQLGVYCFNPNTKRMKLLSIHPGVTKQMIIENSCFEIEIPDNVPLSPTPTENDKKILREIDPLGMVIGK